MCAAPRTDRSSKTGKGDALDWLVPDPAVTLPDGRVVDGALLSAMRAEWEKILGGVISVDSKPRRWVRVVDDPHFIGSRRLLGEGNDVTAVLNHATARAVTAGLREHSGGNVPGNSYLHADVLLADAAVVLLAVLDRHLVGAGDLAAWYLASPCDQRNCLHHGDGRGREHPGKSVEPLELTEIPNLYWLPGLGSVEVDPHVWHEIALRADSTRRIRLATPATVPLGAFQPLASLRPDSR